MKVRILALSTIAIISSVTASYASPKLDLIENHLNPSAKAHVTDTAAHLVYYGGPVLANVKVYAVMWGSTVAAATQSGIGDFYTAITQSGEYDWLSEYNTTIKGVDGRDGTNQMIGHGSFGGQFVIKPINGSTNISNDDIVDELNKQIDAKVLPAPDENSLYMIHFPAGMSIALTEGGQTATSCQQFCAYHNSAKDSLGHNLYFGVIPDVGDGLCAMGCGSNSNVFDNLTMVASHELTEATTDPEVGGVITNAYPLGWMDPDPNNGEIGDICVGNQTSFVAANGKTYDIQEEWSNQSNACIGVTR